MSFPQQSPEPPGRAEEIGRVIVPNRPRWYQRLVAWLIFSLIRLVGTTLRYQWTDLTGGPQASPPRQGIYCIWHNRLVLCMKAYDGFVKPRSSAPGLAALVSASKDGAFLSAILECFGVHPVRGSSSRRGPQALLELTTWAERGYDLALTPDGPRGPRYVVHEGIMYLAQVTGLSITPCAFHLDWKIQIRSWDRFQIPLPFSRCEMVFAKALSVPREATESEREALRLQLERTLREISKD